MERVMVVTDTYPDTHGTQVQGGVLVVDRETSQIVDRINEYVDVRGPWPVYVRGLVAIQLPGKGRDISLDDARVVVSQINQ